MSKGIIDIIVEKIVKKICTPNYIGRRGEKLTERELKLVRLLGRGGKILRNVYVPKENGETSEIDVLYITEKGIFVIESKNYSGWIFGKEKDRYWTATLGRGKRNSFYNPIMQNLTHIKWLKEFLNEDIPLFNIIAFSERCELKKVSIESEDIWVIKRNRLYVTVRDIWNKSESILDESKVQEIYTILEKLTKVDKKIKEDHIENIKKRYKVKEAKESIPKEEFACATESIELQKPEIETESETKQEEKPEELICPKCGAALVKRTVKKGKNSGNEFWGCSSFPKCRYRRKDSSE